MTDDVKIPTQAEWEAMLPKPPPLGDVNTITYGLLVFLAVLLWMICYTGKVLGWWDSAQEGRGIILNHIVKTHQSHDTTRDSTEGK